MKIDTSFHGDLKTIQLCVVALHEAAKELAHAFYDFDINIRDQHGEPIASVVYKELPKEGEDA